MSEDERALARARDTGNERQHADGNVDRDVLEIVVARVLDPRFSSRLSHVAFDWQRLLQVFRCQRVDVHEVGIAAFEHS